jgi:hypothetical protein
MYVFKQIFMLQTHQTILKTTGVQNEVVAFTFLKLFLMLEGTLMCLFRPTLRSRKSLFEFLDFLQEGISLESIVSALLGILWKL